jgi:NAD(P)-dependent dehydrogenase (short-subunit alcohol dehydrogenase family)
MPENDFEGRHVVITGASGALGSSLLFELLGRGAICHLPLIEKDFDFGELEGPSLRKTTGVDLRDESQVGAFFSDLPALWASAHCAGGFAMNSFAETSLDDLRKMTTLNLESAFLCTREALRTLLENEDHPSLGRGRIVNVSAQTALDPRRGAGMAAYAASKSALAHMTLALAEEVAHEGIWVNAVAPSIMDTPANRAAMPDADHAAWASTDAVARTMAFLLSPQNGCSRGGVVPVFGRS